MTDDTGEPSPCDLGYYSLCDLLETKQCLIVHIYQEVLNKLRRIANIKRRKILKVHIKLKKIMQFLYSYFRRSIPVMLKNGL